MAGIGYVGVNYSRHVSLFLPYKYIVLYSLSKKIPFTPKSAVEKREIFFVKKYFLPTCSDFFCLQKITKPKMSWFSVMAITGSVGLGSVFIGKNEYENEVRKSTI